MREAMTTARTIGAPYPQKAVQRVAALLNDLAIYRFCILVALLDIFDVFGYLERNDLAKYAYAAIVIALMGIYLLRWQRVDAKIAPTIFLSLFLITGLAFALRFFVYDERSSYVSAFIAPLVFSATIFIPPNSIMLDARKILRDITILFSVGTVFYLVEAIVRPFVLINSVGPNEVSIIKSLICVLAICLATLMGRKTLGIFLAIVTLIALGLRPTSTLVLALICCVPIAILLRRRVVGYRPFSILMSYALAMVTLILAVSIPVLLYFFYDEVAPVISNFESSLKKEVIGGISSVEFRMAILKLAFATIDDSSFWYGSALSGDLTVPLGQVPSWQWWFFHNPNGDAPIHSDFVIVLCLMGIIGYVVFSSAFYLVLRDRFRELLRRDIYGSRVALQAISVIACVALLIYSSDEPYLTYYSHANAVWMLLLISEMARKSKVVR
jgi:hypothetical protein